MISDSGHEPFVVLVSRRCSPFPYLLPCRFKGSIVETFDISVFGSNRYQTVREIGLLKVAMSSEVKSVLPGRCTS